MKYTFDKNLPYDFKDVTGLAENDNIGQSILEDGKVIGGIISYIMDIPLKEFNTTFKCISICAIEILPEFRNQGKGSAIIQSLLTQCKCINAAVQEEKAWEWWKKMGAMEYMAIMYPEDVGKENPRVHTLAFVLGKDELSTRMFKGIFQMVSSKIEGASESRVTPNIDFSINKSIKEI